VKMTDWLIAYGSAILFAAAFFVLWGITP